MLAAAALAIAGCGGAKERTPPQPVSLTLHVPCMIGGPMHKVAAEYQAAHLGVTIRPETYKPQEALGNGRGPALVVTTGDREMEALVRAGLVDKRQVRTFAVNRYPLVVVAPAEGAPGLKTLADLAGASVKRVLLESPSRSTLGERAAQGLRKLGLWEKVRLKLVEPEPGSMVLGELLAGKGDALVVFKGCLFEEGGAPPKTIRIVGELPLRGQVPVLYQIAPLRGRERAESATEFITFLTRQEGKEALRKARLEPAE